MLFPGLVSPTISLSLPRSFFLSRGLGSAPSISLSLRTLSPPRSPKGTQVLKLVGCTGCGVHSPMSCWRLPFPMITCPPPSIYRVGCQNPFFWPQMGTPPRKPGSASMGQSAFRVRPTVNGCAFQVRRAWPRRCVSGSAGLRFVQAKVRFRSGTTRKPQVRSP